MLNNIVLVLVLLSLLLPIYLAAYVYKPYLEQERWEFLYTTGDGLGIADGTMVTSSGSRIPDQDLVFYDVVNFGFKNGYSELTLPQVSTNGVTFVTGTLTIDTTTTLLFLIIK